MFYFGEDRTVDVTTKIKLNDTIKYTLLLTHWQMDQLKPDPLGSLGIVPYEPKIPAIIYKILPDSPAEKSNLKIGDRIQAIDKTPTTDWLKAVEIIAKHPSQTLMFSVDRKGVKLSIPVMVGAKQDESGQNRGFLGIESDFEWPKEMLRNNKYNPWSALIHAKQNTVDFTLLNFMLRQC